MIPYTSYWQGGYQRTPSDFLILLHKIACFFAKQHYGECHMLTDSKSKFFFENCGYTSVTVLSELDTIPQEYQPTWSLGKIYTYKYLAEQKIHFLHLDYDVFLFKKLPNFIEQADVFVQNIENNCKSWYGIPYFFEICGYTDIIKDNQSEHAFNMGIFGGKNYNFIKDYCDLALDIVFNPLNKQFFIDGGDGFWTRAATAEQWFLSCFGIYKKQTITRLFEDNQIENCAPLEKDCKEYGYCHVWGAKNNEYWKHQIKKLAQKINIE
jgi:hypothetical protein